MKRLLQWPTRSPWPLRPPSQRLLQPLWPAQRPVLRLVLPRVQLPVVPQAVQPVALEAEPEAEAEEAEVRYLFSLARRGFQHQVAWHARRVSCSLGWLVAWGGLLASCPFCRLKLRPQQSVDVCNSEMSRFQPSWSPC